MNILLLIPSSRFAKTVIRDVLYGCWCCGKRIGAGTLPPLTLLSVATVLKVDGHLVKIYDSNVVKPSKKEIEEEVGRADAVIVLTSTMTFLEDAAILYELKDIKPSLLTVVFGAHPTFMPKSSLSHPGIDVIIKKEPEYAIRDLFRNLRDKKPWHSTKGIGYKCDGDTVINDDYPYIGDLDELPVPDRGILPKAKYFNPIISRMPYTTAETSRGCPGKCKFCTAPNIYGGKLRCMSPGKVMQEIEYLIGLGYKEIYYRDETWTTYKARNAELLARMAERKYDITWICNVRTGTVDKETLKLMKKAGCHLIKVGVESGSQRILDRSRKNIALADTAELFKWAKESGLHTHAHLMIGMPGEDSESLKETIRFIEKIRPTTIDVGICTPYPGTDLFDEVAAVYPEIKDGTATSIENLHISGRFNECFTSLKRNEIESHLRKIYRDFYLNPSYVLGWLKRIKNIDDLKKVFFAGLNVVDFSMKKHSV
jgi:radical SAM superfamily enzyme YgiQ (UPF0313 family)